MAVVSERGERGEPLPSGTPASPVASLARLPRSFHAFLERLERFFPPPLHVPPRLLFVRTALGARAAPAALPTPTPAEGHHPLAVARRQPLPRQRARCRLSQRVGWGSRGASPRAPARSALPGWPRCRHGAPRWGGGGPSGPGRGLSGVDGGSAAGQSEGGSGEGSGFEVLERGSVGGMGRVGAWVSQAGGSAEEEHG